MFSQLTRPAYLSVSMCVVRMGGVVFPCRSYVYLGQVYDLEVVNGGGSGLKDIHKAYL